MWSDNETVRDLVNFSHVADIAAERIVGAKGEPLSVGISGDWGVGKSSMMKLLRTSLDKHEDVEFRFVEFNAWLYQNYDDARAALMEAIAATVVEQTVAKKDSRSETVRPGEETEAAGSRRFHSARHLFWRPSYTIFSRWNGDRNWFA